MAETITETQEKPYDLYEDLMSAEDGESNVLNGDDSGEDIIDWVFGKDEEETKEQPKQEVKPDVEAILKKSETGEELSKDEIKALTDAGYEVEESTTEEKKPTEEVKETKEESNTTAYDEYLATLFPDQEFKTRDEKETAIVEFIEKEIKIGQDLVAAFEKAPYLTAIIKDVNAGVDPALAVYRHMPFKQEEEPEPGTPEYKAYIKAQLERENAEKEQEKKRELIKNNFMESGKKAHEFANKYSLADSKKQAFFQEVNDILENVKMGKIDERFYEIVIKGKAYDADIKKAEETGMDKGARQAKGKYLIRKVGDGLPKITSTKIKEKTLEKDDPFDKTLDEVGSRQKTNWGIVKKAQ
jgi:hypothetical protein